jgi:hypothetical protein
MMAQVHTGLRRKHRPKRQKVLERDFVAFEMHNGDEPELAAFTDRRGAWQMQSMRIG